jgi:hypothetical protein
MCSWRSVKLGVIASLPRPGDNITGVSFLINELDARKGRECILLGLGHPDFLKCVLGLRLLSSFITMKPVGHDEHEAIMIRAGATRIVQKYGRLYVMLIRGLSTILSNLSHKGAYEQRIGCTGSYGGLHGKLWGGARGVMGGCNAHGARHALTRKFPSTKRHARPAAAACRPMRPPPKKAKSSRRPRASGWRTTKSASSLCRSARASQSMLKRS